MDRGTQLGWPGCIARMYVLVAETGMEAEGSVLNAMVLHNGQRDVCEL